MSSEFGRTLRVGVFGQSHGAAIGVTVDGLPAGERIDLAELQAFLDRRRPGKSPLSTARKENDVPQFLSGLRDGVTSTPQTTRSWPTSRAPRTRIIPRGSNGAGRRICAAADIFPAA